jgi:secreted trypsin-like serine protease
MRRRSLVVFIALILSMLVALPALAITKGGTLDGEDHPYVGLMVADDEEGNPLWRCSGSMISPKVFVTAGHCTEAPAARATIWFETDVQSGIPDNGYPGGGATSHDGTAYTHPFYDPDAFFLFDLGVVVLDEPVDLPAYAELPDVGAIDELENGRNRSTVTAVGYGLQNANKNHTVADRIRMQADLFVVNTEGVAGIGHLKLPSDLPPTNSVILSGDAKHGGTCFGDSGGPGLLGGTDTIVAVNSFGLNGNCAGIGGMFRIDRQLEIDWIESFLD